MNRLLFVITTYNKSEYAVSCIESIQKITDIDFDLVVVDDCSTDDTVELCRNMGVRVITKTTGCGLTDSWNIGYKLFKDSEQYDYVILASHDILVPNNSLTELVEVADKNNYSLICPLSTERGSGHNHQAQSVEVHYNGVGDIANDFNNYQIVQDEILKIKKSITSANNLYQLDPFRTKMFNGFFFLMNRNIINYEHETDVLFDPQYPITKNDDEFNWGKLIPNNDFPAVCKTSFVFHFKGVVAQGLLRDNSRWKEEREKHEIN